MVWTKHALAKPEISRGEFNMNGGLQTRAGVARLQLLRNEGGRGLSPVENRVNVTRVDINA